MDKILNCQHCNVPAEVRQSEIRVGPFKKTRWMVRCPGCGECTIGIYDKENDAIKGWNRLQLHRIYG